MEMEKAKYFPSSVEWRRWLAKNHDKVKDVWLVHYKKGSSERSVSHDSAVEEALCFGWIDGQLKSVDGEKFILRYSPRKSTSVWSEINKKRAERQIALGKMTRAGLKKVEEAKRNGLWDKAYTNRKKEKMPPDLKDSLSNPRLPGLKAGAWSGLTLSRASCPRLERRGLALANGSRNRDAWRNFRQFANSYRNMYIGWVTGAKTEQTRKRRIEEVVNRSSLNKKPGIE